MHHSVLVRVLPAGIAVLGTTLIWPRPAESSHTTFSYQVERFEAEGNRMGPSDGIIDVVDEFDDGTLWPWAVQFGSAFERDGALTLAAPGVHFPSPDGGALDLGIVASSSPSLWPHDGEGDFMEIAYWRQSVPLVDQHYHFSLFTVADGGSLGFNETFGIGIRRTSTLLEIEQHLTEIDIVQGIFQNLSIEVVPISMDDAAGPVAFRIDFDDETNHASSSFSLDGGATWHHPFPPREIFVERDYAVFILSADPSVTAPGASTPSTSLAGTSSTTTSTTTSTTAPFGPTTTTVVETLDRSLDHLAGVLPDPATLLGRPKQTARALARCEQRAQKRIQKGQNLTGNRQRRQYGRAQRQLEKLLRVARRADRRGDLGTPFETVAEAVRGVMDHLRE